MSMSTSASISISISTSISTSRVPRSRRAQWRFPSAYSDDVSRGAIWWSPSENGFTGLRWITSRASLRLLAICSVPRIFPHHPSPRYACYLYFASLLYFFYCFYFFSPLDISHILSRFTSFSMLLRFIFKRTFPSNFPSRFKDYIFYYRWIGSIFSFFRLSSRSADRTRALFSLSHSHFDRLPERCCHLFRENFAWFEVYTHSCTHTHMSNIAYVRTLRIRCFSRNRFYESDHQACWKASKCPGFSQWKSDSRSWIYSISIRSRYFSS